MGSCLSTKSTNSSSPSPLQDPKPPVQISSKIEPEKPKTEDEAPKKDILIVKHRKSNDRRSEEEKPIVEKVTGVTESGSCVTGSNLTSCRSENGSGVVVSAQVRTSSCTKEEVDAILIQCGRLSRSSSMGKVAISSGSGENASTPQRGKKYSGSKRSYDFDNEGRDNRYDDNVVDDDDEAGAVERIHRHRQRHRQARAGGGGGSSPHSRRRTPSRERDQQQQQRSGSRERASGGGSGGRRVSRSPGKRSESPITCGGNAANNSNGRPGKMVSVPATVSSMAMDKSNGGGGIEGLTAGGVKRIQVKRNAGAGDQAVGSRTAASPRSRSPARAILKSSNENQPLSLSRSNSRKAEHSPYRRNPLSEIDNNAAGFEQSAPFGNKGQMKKPNAENVQVLDTKVTDKGTQELDTKVINKGTQENNAAATVNYIAKENPITVENNKGVQPVTNNVAVNVVSPPGPENPKPQTLTRTRSARKSRDLDINLESLTNPTPSYTALLLEDIQNFHHKTNTPSFSNPPCLAKACSILEAVAELNSTTSSNLSSVFTDDRRKNPTADENSSTRGKKRVDSKEIIESEVIGTDDDLLQPSFHKYVTVRRGPVGSEKDEQESSGSNSYVGGPQQWNSSSWEPNSADSIDCYNSSRSNVKEDVGIQRKRESDNQQNGIGRGRVGIGRVYTGTKAEST